MFAGWLFEKKIIKKENINWDKLLITGTAFTGWIWLTALTSISFKGGVLAALTFTKFFLAFLVVSDMVRTVPQIRSILKVFAVGLVVQLLMVSTQVLTGSWLEIQGAKFTTTGRVLVYESGGGTHVTRPSGFLHHPNVLADYLVFVLPVLLIFVILGQQLVGRKVWGYSCALFAGGSAALALSLSRGGWISFVVAALFMIYFGFRNRIVLPRHLMVLMTLVIIGTGFISIFYPGVILRITQRDQSSTESRIIMMDQALLIIRRNPFMGVGFGGYNRAARDNIPASYARVNKGFQDDLKKGIVHNKYLLVAAEHGLVGLALFILLLYRSISTFFQVQVWRDKVYFGLALGLASAMVGQVIFYVFDHFYSDERIEMFWVFLGLLSALVSMQNRAAGARISLEMAA